MKKRFFSAMLTVIILLTPVACAWAFSAAPENPFSLFDSSRESSLKASLLPTLDEENETASPLPDGERYIVKFRSDISLSDIEKALRGKENLPIADSTERLFSVCCDKEFLKEISPLTEYYEADAPRKILASDDPLEIPAFSPMSVYPAWDKVPDLSGITIAVLDTGIERSHEDFAGVNILNGYDAVKRASGVSGDSSGHGTAVAGVIAAAANNKKGFAGIARGVTLLPVKVSTTGATIYSSDLISGIRFAADAGADIINMSVGGYSPSYAEQEAVDYAVNKGCILVAASGNEGDRSYAGQKSYPASYEGVVSVASVSQSGEVSAFSQFNDAVDVAAYGENIPILAFEDGRSVYKYDSGTSYSCALVSGVAALALASAGDARFESAEFDSLIKDICGDNRNDHVGHGIVNAERAVDFAKLPIVTGVRNGGVYSDKIKIGFNRGKATVDGESIIDGETVLVGGKHILKVADGENEKVFSFRLNYDPLSYEIKEYSTFSTVSFSRGEAYLDGFVYKSGDKIDTFGKHIFELTDGDEILTDIINVSPSFAEVNGIGHDNIYDHPVHVSSVGAAKTTLDGVTLISGATVYENGMHLVDVFSENGSGVGSYTFYIDSFDSEKILSDYSSPKAFRDEENGYYVFYGESLVGARIYYGDSPEKYDVFLPIGTVFSHCLCGDYLVLLTENGITVMERAALRDKNPVTRSDVTVCDAAVPYGDKALVFVGSEVLLFDPENLSFEPFAIIPEPITAVACDENGFIAYSGVSGVIYKYSFETKTISFMKIADRADAKVLVSMDYIVIGNKVFSTENGEFLTEFASESAVCINGDMLFTSDSVIDCKTGETLGVFPLPISDITFGAKENVLYGVSGEVLRVSAEREFPYSVCAAKPDNKSLTMPETTNVYRRSSLKNPFENVLSAGALDDSVYFVTDGSYVLHSVAVSDMSETVIPLRYRPSKVFCGENKVAVAFCDADKLFLLSEGNMTYLDIPSVCKDACFDGNNIYAVCGNKLYAVDIGSNTRIDTGVVCEEIEVFGGYFYAINEKTLTKYDKSLSAVSSVRVSETALKADSFLSVGSNVYSRDLGIKAVLTKPILASKGDAVVTENGLYSISESAYIGDIGVDSPKLALFTPDNSLFVFSDNAVVKHSYDDGAALISLPTFTGLENGKTYKENLKITFDRGVSFLDGVPFASGKTVSERGEHTLVTALPCGRRISSEFRISVGLSSISFVVPERHMSVGETIILHILYLPEGADSVPVKFECADDGITIDPSGTVSAAKVGEYTVSALTADGKLKASCKIIVSDKLVAFKEDAPYFVDRENGIVRGIPAGTKAKDLLSSLATSADAKIIGKNGKENRSVVRTGDKITLTDGENTLDELELSVSGDVDCDGYVSAYDLYVLEKILKGSSASSCLIASADLTGDGVLTNNDYLFLRDVLLKKQPFAVGEPENNLFGSFSVVAPTYVTENSVIDVALCISGCKHTKAVSGVLTLPEGLEFVSAYSSGWECEFSETEKGVAFRVCTKDGSECGSAFKVLCGLKLRVLSGNDLSVGIDPVTVKLGDKTVSVASEECVLKLSEAKTGEFSFNVTNAHSFRFNKDTYEYRVTVPYDSALADIEYTCEEGGSVYISETVIPDGGELDVHISHSDGVGGAGYYTLHIRRDAEPDFDSNCRLAMLEAEGFRLSPAFDPDIFDYSFSVPFGTEEINLYCVAQSKTAEVIISDCKLYSDVNEITVTVVSPDGETLTYTLTVEVLPAESSEEETSDIPEDDGSKTKVLIVVSAAALIVGAALFMRFRSKEDTDADS